MAKWKYGNYEFRINPSSVSNSIDFVGDELRTLNGALVSQPTGTKESYEVDAVFYQPRTRAISEVSLAADYVDLYNAKYYCINKSNIRIDIYNSNMSYASSISLSAIANKNFKGIDVVNDGIWILCRDEGVADYITKINHAGTIIIGQVSLPIIVGQHITDVEQMSGYLYALRAGRIERLSIPTLSKSLEFTIPLNGTTKGLSSDGTYIIVGVGDLAYGNIIYHVDTSNGKIVNAISSDDLIAINSLAYGGNNFYVFSSNKLQKLFGNTTMLDINNLEKQIDSYSFVNLVDDAGTTRRVMVSSINKQRQLGYENMHNISLTIEKIDRG